MRCFKKADRIITWRGEEQSILCQRHGERAKKLCLEIGGAVKIIAIGETEETCEAEIKGL